MNESQLKYLGIGIAVSDKNDNSKTLAVYPQEHMPFHEGDISSTHAATEYNGLDDSGNAYNVTLQKGMSVKAIWLGQPNRITSPNVRKGEQVKLYEVADTGEYYWKEMGRDAQLRRGETVAYAFSATTAPSTTDIAPTAENHYTATIDGVNGHMTITTSQANGEKAGFTIQANGKEGHFTVKDNFNNIIQVNSVNGSITITNKAGSYITSNKDEITCKNKTGSFVTINSDSISAQNNTGTNVILNGSSANVKGGGTLTIDFPNIQINGNVQINGNLETKGTSKSDGDINCTNINTTNINGVNTSQYLGT